MLLYWIIVETISGDTGWSFAPISDKYIRRELFMKSNALYKARSELRNQNIIFVKKISTGTYMYKLNEDVECIMINMEGN